MGLSSIEIVARCLAIVLPLAGLLVALFSKEDAMLFGIVFSARYSYSSAFRFLVGADAVACVLSALSLGFVCFLGRSESNVKNNFILFLQDLITTLLMISGCAAASAIGFVAQHGETKMAWEPVCNFVKTYCRKVTLSVGFSYVAFFIYLALTIVSAKNLIPKSYK